MILYGVTIVTSAFLLFLVQPIIAKQILPWFGGSAAVWTTCVVFFQAVLLAGYAYAHALTRRAPKVQGTLHFVLLCASIASLPIIASSGWKPSPDDDPTGRIAGLLVATIGLPYFLLSSTGPLIQKWFADDRAQASRAASVYRLFALSNLGSLVGLLAYPFIVEPYATSTVQSWGWSAGYVLFAAACAACAWRVRQRREDPVSESTPEAAVESGPAPRLRDYAFWLACSALGSTLLLALTNHITQNVASIPFLWVLPLALYLLSFVIVFEGRAGRGWYVRRWWMAPVLAMVIAMAWALQAHRGVLDLHVAIPVFCAGLFFACVFCHGELAATRPAPAYLTQFYLCLSAGGALGGLFVALVAPRLFVNYWEAPIALVGLCILAFIAARERSVAAWAIGGLLGALATFAILLAGGGATFDAIRDALPGHESTAFTTALVVFAAVLFVASAWRGWTMTILVASLASTGYFAVKYYRFLSLDTLYASRNFYGTLRVKDNATQRSLMHGVILHGDQYMTDAKRGMATTYYGPGSGLALALRTLRPEGQPMDVAMIGMGTGTTAAWGRPGDRYRIYELDPQVPYVANRFFTYLSGSRAQVTTVLGDARLSMERESADGTRDASTAPFDIIAVDAFSSDSIPVHLITREALRIYLQRLKPDGVIAFHVSNRFLRLAPVVSQLAADAGLSAIDVSDDPSDEMYSSSEWVLVTRNEVFLDRDDVLDASTEIDDIRGLPIWTDQFNNLFKILK